MEEPLAEFRTYITKHSSLDGRQLRAVWRKGEQRFALVVLDANPEQRCWVVLDRVEVGQGANLIADDARSPVRFQRTASLEARVRLGADDVEAFGLMQAMQLFKIAVAAVHDVETASFPHQRVEEVGLVPLAVDDVSETREVAAQVGQRMYLHRLGGAKWRPRKYQQTQVDGRSIQCIHGAGQIDTKRLFSAKLARDDNQALREVCIDAAVANRFGVGQRVPRYRAAKTHVVKLGCLTAQTGFDIAQAFPIG